MIVAFRRLCTAVVAFALGGWLLAACSGGGASPAPDAAAGPVSPSGSSNAPQQTPAANVSFTITIPAPSSAYRTRHPEYISQSTKSVVVLRDKHNAVVIPLTAGSPNCSTASGKLSCRAAVKTPAGNNYYTLTLYPTTNGTGVPLSTNTTPRIPVAPGQTVQVRVTLLGIVSKAVLTLATPNPPAGRAATIPLSVALEDGGGNLIVGSAPFDYPVTLVSSDPAHGPVSKIVLKAPSDEQNVSVQYDGARVPSITYSATSAQLPPANVTPAVLTPQ